MELSAELRQRIDEAVSHYPVSKRSAALPLLHLLQEEFGFISDEAADWIAARLELQPINILEILTFYPMFRRQPPGRHHIRVCRTLSCAMGGSYELFEQFRRLAGIESEHGGHAHNGSAAGHGSPIKRSADGKFSIEFVECLASCGTAPVCMINDDFYEGVATESAAADLLNRYP
jgi:NADH-quinone oxidoreductase subunit E